MTQRQDPETTYHGPERRMLVNLSKFMADADRARFVDSDVDDLMLELRSSRTGSGSCREVEMTRLFLGYVE